MPARNETTLALLPTLAANPDRVTELRDLAEQLHADGVAWQDIAAAAGTPTATLVARLDRASRSTADKRARNSRTPARDWREPTAPDVRRMRQLWRRVPQRRSGSYDWQSAPAVPFLAAAGELVEAGVPIIWISSQLYDMDGHSVGPSMLRNRISTAMGGSPHGRGLQHRTRNPAVQREGWQRRTPDEARCPQRSRRLLGIEWEYLLLLHSQIEVGGYAKGMPEAERNRRQARLLARDTEILRLWADRVSVPRMADVLGMSEGGVENVPASTPDRPPAGPCSGGNGLPNPGREQHPNPSGSPTPKPIY